MRLGFTEKVFLSMYLCQYLIINIKSFCRFIFWCRKMPKIGVNLFNESWLTEERFIDWLLKVSSTTAKSKWCGFLVGRRQVQLCLVPLSSNNLPDSMIVPISILNVEIKWSIKVVQSYFSLRSCLDLGITKPCTHLHQAPSTSTQLISTSTQLHPPPPSSFQPPPSSTHLHLAHFSLHPALCNTLNNI